LKLKKRYKGHFGQKIQNDQIAVAEKYNPLAVGTSIIFLSKLKLEVHQSPRKKTVREEANRSKATNTMSLMLKEREREREREKRERERERVIC
jgi:hypothetical protein